MVSPDGRRACLRSHPRPAAPGAHPRRAVAPSALVRDTADAVSRSLAHRAPRTTSRGRTAGR